MKSIRVCPKNRLGMSAPEMREAVIEALEVGDKVCIPFSDGREGARRSDENRFFTVKGFYGNYVLFQNSYGMNCSYCYSELYILFRNLGTIEEVAPRKQGDEEDDEEWLDVEECKDETTSWMPFPRECFRRNTNKGGSKDGV